MSTQGLPLLELFIQLHKAGLPLGIDEYQLVLHALQAGFGISDRDALKRLCRTLWVKSADDDHLFDYHFEQLMPQLSELDIQPEQPEQPETPPSSPPSQPVSDLTIPDTSTSTISELTAKVEDEVRIAQAVLQAVSIDVEVSSSHSYRQMSIFL